MIIDKGSYFGSALFLRVQTQSEIYDKMPKAKKGKGEAKEKGVEKVSKRKGNTGGETSVSKVSELFDRIDWTHTDDRELWGARFC